MYYASVRVYSQKLHHKYTYHMQNRTKTTVKRTEKWKWTKKKHCHHDGQSSWIRKQNKRENIITIALLYHLNTEEQKKKEKRRALYVKRIHIWIHVVAGGVCVHGPAKLVEIEPARVSRYYCLFHVNSRGYFSCLWNERKILWESYLGVELDFRSNRSNFWPGLQFSISMRAYSTSHSPTLLKFTLPFIQTSNEPSDKVCIFVRFPSLFSLYLCFTVSHLVLHLLKSCVFSNLIAGYAILQLHKYSSSSSSKDCKG